MRSLWFCLGILLFMGCGKSDVRPSKAYGGYPALNESPPPPLLPESRFRREIAAAPVSPAPAAAPVSMDAAAEETGDGFMAQTLRKEALLQSMREYAAQAGTNDPFALTEKEIDELSKLDELIIY